MAVTTFDLPYPKTACCTQTSRLYLLQNRTYCRLKLYIAEIGNFAKIAPVTLTLTRCPSYTNLPYPGPLKMYLQTNQLASSKVSKVIVLHTATYRTLYGIKSRNRNRIINLLASNGANVPRGGGIHFNVVASRLSCCFVGTVYKCFPTCQLSTQRPLGRPVPPPSYLGFDDVMPSAPLDCLLLGLYTWQTINPGWV